jgi:ribosomal protein L40E
MLRLNVKEAAVQCSKCAANLPDGSQFCLKCGQPLSHATPGPASQTVAASLGCSKCGADLPDEAQFCLKCGKPVSSSAKKTMAAQPPDVQVLPTAIRPPRRQRRGLLFFLFVILLLGLIVLVATSDSPFAQDIQEMVGWKHDQIVLDAPFKVGPHTFRYYKFSLPEGSVNVAIVGQFTADAENPAAPGRKTNDNDKGKNSDNTDKTKNAANDAGVEVYVLTDAAFTVWQNGYATSSLYDSGVVPVGSVEADIPAGAGVYYLVFSNKSSPKTAKSVHATVLLRYKSWLPEWFRRMKDRFWNWVGA